MSDMLSSALARILAPDRKTAVVDVGANPIDGDPPYKDMLASGLCSVTGFEPQADALARLNAAKGENETYLGMAIGDGNEHTLYLTKAPGMASLLRPDPARLALFNGFLDWGEVVGQQRMETTSLDDSPVGVMDLLKIDVQGSELMVFRGARRLLSSAIAVHVEVSFVPLYKDQPSIGEIDLELRGLGFIPHCFAAIKQWPIAPLVIDGDFRMPLNQLLEADMVYVRDFCARERMSNDQLKHLALIAHHVYGSFDLAVNCVQELGVRRVLSATAMDDYLGSVAQA